MIYLGIDPGTTIIGYGIIDTSGRKPKPLAWGVFRNPGVDSSLDKQATESALSNLIAQWKPDGVGIEKLFFLNNKKSAMAVSEMRGVLMLTLAHHNVPVREFTPLQVKQYVCGHGGAKKPQVQKMIQLLLNISEPITPDDAADALALALCAWSAESFR